MMEFPPIPINDKSLQSRIAFLEREARKIAPLVKFSSFRVSQPEAVQSVLDEIEARADDAKNKLASLDPLSEKLAIPYAIHKSAMDSMKNLLFLLTNIENQLESCQKELALRRGQLDDLRKAQSETKTREPKY